MWLVFLLVGGIIVVESWFCLVVVMLSMGRVFEFVFFLWLCYMWVCLVGMCFFVVMLDMGKVEVEVLGLDGVSRVCYVWFSFFCFCVVVEVNIV